MYSKVQWYYLIRITINKKVVPTFISNKTGLQPVEKHVENFLGFIPQVKKGKFKGNFFG